MLCFLDCTYRAVADCFIAFDPGLYSHIAQNGGNVVFHAEQFGAYINTLLTAYAQSRVNIRICFMHIVTWTHR